MNLYLSCCLETPLAELAEILNSSFEGYVVPIQLNPLALSAMIRVDAVDLASSRIVWRDDQPVGIGLIARRGWESRLAAMAVVPEARGQGVARWLLEHLLREAETRHERRIVLEVIEQNPAAVTLYERFGFQTLRRLAGFRHESLLGTDMPELEEIPLAEVGSAMLGSRENDMPWQAAGEAIVQLAYPHRGYRVGPVVIAITDPELSQIAIRGIWFPKDQSPDLAAKLILSLAARFPERTWRVAPIFPEDWAGALFEPLGFARETISQFQMARLLQT